jgi:NAD(P)-dependent dehydrogenase (short-subunit alcohol dehydrogenase family)
MDMKNIIVITELRAFGALAARALAIAGHTVYASMRETTDRNAAQVEAARQFAQKTAWTFARLNLMWPLRNQRRGHQKDGREGL